MVTRGRRGSRRITCSDGCWAESRSTQNISFDMGVQGRHLPAQVLLRNLPVLRRSVTSRSSTTDPRSRPTCSRSSLKLPNGFGKSLVSSYCWTQRQFRRRRNRRGRPERPEGRIAYRGPNITRGTLPKVKFDLTSDEVLVVTSRVASDRSSLAATVPLPVRGVLAYPSPQSCSARKLRALAERCRPRDLYDVVYLHRHPDLIGRACRCQPCPTTRSVRTPVLTFPLFDVMLATPFRSGNRERMGQHAGASAAAAASFSFLKATGTHSVTSSAGCLEREVRTELPRAELGDLDPGWSPPVAIRSWRRGLPVRAAAVCRSPTTLKSRSTTDPEQGPDRTAGGRAVLATPDSGGQPRVVRRQRSRLTAQLPVDRIIGVRPTTKTFTARFRVEL